MESYDFEVLKDDEPISVGFAPEFKSCMATDCGTRKEGGRVWMPDPCHQAIGRNRHSRRCRIRPPLF
jgi:hypothetical protein